MQKLKKKCPQLRLYWRFYELSHSRTKSGRILETNLCLITIGINKIGLIDKMKST